MSGQENFEIKRWARIAVFGRNPKVTLIRIAVLAVVSVIVFRYILLPIQVEGISMLPTYQDHTIHFVYRLAYLSHVPQRGDVVGLRAGDKNSLGRVPSVMYMKRIVGLPGEMLSFDHGRIYINGELLPEPYLKLESNWRHAPIPLGSNQYYFVGDNRSMPFAYHFQGRADRDQIVGRVVF